MIKCGKKRMVATDSLSGTWIRINLVTTFATLMIIRG